MLQVANSRKFRSTAHGRARGKEYSLTPKAKYNKHRNHAKSRGIEFNLTFKQWWALWKEYFAARSKEATNLVMCRERDLGAYELGNVRIDTASNNSKERHCHDFNAKTTD
jgi:hypothetical protein